MTWTPDGAFLSMALEQAPNAEKDTNKVSTNVFYLPARQFDDVDGWAPLDEQDALKATLALAPHLGTGTYGVALGTQAGTIVATGTNLGPYTFQWVDFSGTAPVPVYQLTCITASGTATINSAVISVTPLAP